MIDDYEIKKEKEKINKKISSSAFIHIYVDNKRNKNNKCIQIIDELKKNEGEIIYIYLKIMNYPLITKQSWKYQRKIESLI